MLDGHIVHILNVPLALDFATAAPHSLFDVDDCVFPSMARTALPLEHGLAPIEGGTRREQPAASFLRHGEDMFKFEFAGAPRTPMPHDAVPGGFPLMPLPAAPLHFCGRIQVKLRKAFSASFTRKLLHVSKGYPDLLPASPRLMGAFLAIASFAAHLEEGNSPQRRRGAENLKVSIAGSTDGVS
jgi:hypothetical protein